MRPVIDNLIFNEAFFKYLKLQSSLGIKREHITWVGYLD